MCNISANVSVFQTEEEGSIPSTRTIFKVLMNRSINLIDETYYSYELYNYWDSCNLNDLMTAFNLNSCDVVLFPTFIECIQEECGIVHTVNNKFVKVVDKRKYVFAKLKYGF